jgi:16S rRNA (guanine(966)-N(2))-methyltransferase RsmD
MVPGGATRPITDRVKENLFTIVGHDVINTRWLDLFAGTGQVGIEALSRGASDVVFVDHAPAAIKVINQNLNHTGLQDRATVIRDDSFRYLRRKQKDQFDVIYIAPPQYKGLWFKTLSLIDDLANEILAENAKIIIQIDPREYAEQKPKHLLLDDQRKYGRTMLCFYESNVSNVS